MMNEPCPDYEYKTPNINNQMEAHTTEEGTQPDFDRGDIDQPESFANDSTPHVGALRRGDVLNTLLIDDKNEIEEKGYLDGDHIDYSDSYEFESDGGRKDNDNDDDSVIEIDPLGSRANISAIGRRGSGLADNDHKSDHGKLKTHNNNAIDDESLAVRGTNSSSGPGGMGRLNRSLSDITSTIPAAKAIISSRSNSNSNITSNSKAPWPVPTVTSKLSSITRGGTTRLASQALIDIDSEIDLLALPGDTYKGKQLRQSGNPLMNKRIKRFKWYVNTISHININIDLGQMCT